MATTYVKIDTSDLKGFVGKLDKAAQGEFKKEVGTNVKYAEYADKGHWLNPKGVNTRFVPGYWQGEHFIYEPGAKTGMLLKQKWIEGSHYWGDAVRCIEDMLPGLMEQKMEQWLQQFFM